MACRVAADFVPRYAALAGEVKRLTDGGAALVVIGAKLSVNYDTARAALAFATRGERPISVPRVPRKWTGERSGPPLYVTTADDVARRWDGEGLRLVETSGRLGVNEATARRAYDHYHRDRFVAAVETGATLTRGRRVVLSAAQRDEARERLGRCESLAAAAAVGCSTSTVRRIPQGC